MEAIQRNSRALYQRRVVCAANRHLDTNVLVIGPRHYDETMHKHIAQLGYRNHEMEQGFIDQHGVFMSREEAYLVATEANQIRSKSGNPDEPVLYSEDLY